MCRIVLFLVFHGTLTGGGFFFSFPAGGWRRLSGPTPRGPAGFHRLAAGAGGGAAGGRQGCGGGVVAHGRHMAAVSRLACLSYPDAPRPIRFRPGPAAWLSPVIKGSVLPPLPPFEGAVPVPPYGPTLRFLLRFYHQLTVWRPGRRLCRTQHTRTSGLAKPAVVPPPARNPHLAPQRVSFLCRCLVCARDPLPVRE